VNKAASLVGKTVDGVYLSRRKTIVVIATSDGDQFEITFGHSTKLIVAGLINLLGKTVESQASEKHGFYCYCDSLANFRVMPFDRRDVYGPPEVTKVNGLYALNSDSTAIKKLLNFRHKARVFQITEDTRYRPIND
jgi:hypothetical protein